MADDTKPDPDPKDDPKGDDDKLGEGGKKALDRERQARRDAEKQAKELTDRLEALEDKEKSDLERAASDRDGHKTRADSAERNLQRMEVALDKAPEGMSISRVRTLAKRLSGDTREDLERDAEELFAELGETPKGDDDGKGDKGDDDNRVGDRPKEHLRGGGDPDDEPDESDPRKLAAGIPRSGF